MQLHQMFLRQAKQHAGDPAFIDRNTRKTISYGRALVAALILARRFRRLGDGYLGIMIPNSAGAALSIIGALFAGKTPVMINYSTGASENAEYAQKKCNFHTIITSRALLEKLGCRLVPGMLFIEDLMEQLGPLEKLLGALKARLPTGLLGRLVHDGSIHESVVVLFTSGSEKDPKAVDLSHRNIGSNIDAAQQLFHFTAADRMLCNLPYFHVFGHMANLWLPIAFGMPLVTYANPLDFKTIVRIIREERVTVMFGTPFFLMGYLKQADEGDLDSLRLVVAGADKLPAQLREAYAEQHGIEVFEGYGVTETSPLISVNLPGSNKPGSIGRPAPGVEVRITDIDSGETLPAGEEGKILVRGEMVMKGYLDDLEETALKIKDGWYETGDMGMLDEDGYLWHRGRLKRFAKIGGEMVSLVNVESALEKLLPPGIECCVVEVPDSRKGAMIAVALDGEIDDKAVTKQLAGTLPPLAMPRRFLVFDELPKMGSGKIDFRSTTDMVIGALRQETAQRHKRQDLGLKRKKQTPA